MQSKKVIKYAGIQRTTFLSSSRNTPLERFRNTRYKNIATNTEDLITASEPVAKPNVEAKKPNPEAKKPNIEAKKPNIEAKKPDAEGKKEEIASSKEIKNFSKSYTRKILKTFTPKVRLKFYLPTPQRLPPRRTIRQLLNFI
jgi:hypothetical protein